MNNQITTENNLKGLIPENYLRKALLYYNNLTPHFSNPGSGYWMLGCMLDSMIDFLNLAGQYSIVPYSEGSNFLDTAAKAYLYNQCQGEWYDDWMWWGNSTAKVYNQKYANLFNTPLLQANFKTICSQTFDFVKTGKTPYHQMDHSGYVGTMKAYDHAKEMAAKHTGEGWESIVTNAEPMWNIGCWQAPMTPSNYNPFYTSLGPFQDSVVNGLFYIFAQRTINQPGLGTQSDIDEMTAFYRNWMSQDNLKLPADKQLFNALLIGSGLFRERVSMYKNGDAVNGYKQNLAWTGDQGLMLCALTNLYYSQSGTAQQETLYTIKATINGVFDYAIGNIGEYTNVIMPWCNIGELQPGNPPGNDSGDYFSGTGIFMRGLLEASQIPEVKPLINDVKIQDIIKSTLRALLDGDGTQYMNYIFENNPPPNTDPHEWFDDFNKMATLVAASQLLHTE